MNPMALKSLKLPKFPVPNLAWRPGREAIKRVMLAGLLAASIVGAFLWGRHGSLNQARGQSSQPQRLDTSIIQQAAHGERGRHVVAYIYGDIPITREEFG